MIGQSPEFGMRMNSEHETILDEDEQDDARYFKFFGKGNATLESTPHSDTPTESPKKSDENCRDLMLKPSPRGSEDRKRSEHS